MLTGAECSCPTRRPVAIVHGKKTDISLSPSTTPVLWNECNKFSLRAELEGQTVKTNKLKEIIGKKEVKEESYWAPRDTDHNTCQFLQPNLERKAWFAVLCYRSIRMCLFDPPPLFSHSPQSLLQKNHGLVWNDAQPLFFGKNLISCTCHCENSSAVDAAHQNRRSGGKNALRVRSDLQDINKPGDTGKGDMRAAAAAGDVYVGALLVSGLVSGAAGKKQRVCSCLAAPALQNPEWLMMPSRGGCLTLAPNQFPQTVAVLSGCGISWSGAWLEDRKGSKGAVKRRGQMEVHLYSDEAVSLHW